MKRSRKRSGVMRSRKASAYFVPEQDRDLAEALQPRIREALQQVVLAHNHGNLDPQTMRWAAAAINCLFCIRGWLSLTEDWEMDEHEASDMTAWAAHLILSGIRHNLDAPVNND